MEINPRARLFVALSQNKTSNIVLRRGPANQVAVFGWNRKTDTFKLGQWLKGRIYEHRLDISPDGKHIIYLALGRRGKTWTAISRAPYLKALDFYPWLGTWGGGGIFHTSGSYTLHGHGNGDDIRLESGLEVSKFTSLLTNKNDEITSLYHLRLIRDGWCDVSAKNAYGRYVEMFEKQVSEHWTLRKTLVTEGRQNRSMECEELELINADQNLLVDLPDWEWAEVDGRQLLWAANGCLYRGEVAPDGNIVKQKELHNFNAYTFEEKIAPY